MKPHLYFRRGFWYCSGGPYLTRAPRPSEAYSAWRVEHDRRFGASAIGVGGPLTGLPAFKPVDLGAPA